MSVGTIDGSPVRGRLRRCCQLALVACGTAACATVPRQPAAVDIASLEARARAEPMDVANMTRLGAAYHQAGRADDARAILNRAIAADPGHAGPYLYLGILHEEREEYADARRLYESYLTRGGTRAMRERIIDRLELLERKELVSAVKRARADEANLTRQPPEPGTVAVFPFFVPAEDTELAPLRTALAELLITDLSQTTRLRVLERTRVQEMLDELALAERAAVDDATAARTGRILAAERLVQPRVGRTDDVLRLTAAVARASADSLQRVGDVGVEDRMRRLFDLQTQFALDTYRALGVQLSSAERDRIARRPTRNLQALLAYGLGLEAWDRDDYRAAQRHFATASDLDGGFAAARASERTATATAAASEITTAQLSELAESEADVTPIDWAAIEQLVPRAGGRDAASEALGREVLGGGGGSAWLDIILQRR